jgi:UDP-N-acetylmuramoylalanine--D-glutamate ligase
LNQKLQKFIEENKAKRVAILGLGIEGVAIYNFLKDDFADITLLDKTLEAEILEKASKEVRDLLPPILADKRAKKIFSDHYLDNLTDYDLIFRSPGIYFADPNLLLAKEAGTTVTSQIKLFFELCPCKIIGVTGTKGKGTTASLIFEILNLQAQSEKQKTESQGNVFLAGNIGIPAIDLLDKLQPEDLVVLELSNFQLADLCRSPEIAIVTNIGVDHLDYHKNFDEYIEAKFNILAHQEAGDFAIINTDSSFDQTRLSNIKSSKKYFSKSDSDADAIVAQVDDKNTVILDPQNRKVEICREGEIKLLGRHNLENIAAASIAADLLNVPAETIRKAVREFSGLPYRLEMVKDIDGVRFVNDSFATNPGPTMAAIDSFREPKILILGGSSKGSDFTELAYKIALSDVPAVILIGAEAEKIQEALRVANYGGGIIKGGMEIGEIVRQAKEAAKPGEIVIFSPACASFDMFKNYKDRGEKFKKAVLAL